MRNHVTKSILFSLALVALARGNDGQPGPLVVHEWGTFTVLQDDDGNAVNGVNINEESLPAFVHELAPDLAPDSQEFATLTGVRNIPLRRSKGISRHFHAARMRMETPIIYLYPPQDQPAQPIDVQVDFQGGWITEWYPKAEVVAPGYAKNHARVMMELKPSTTGRINWNDIRVAHDAKVPETEFPVWLAPRQTAAPIVQTPGGEAENYLFYRGVANLEAPLRVIRDGDTLTIKTNPSSTCPIEDFRNLELWLVDVDPQRKLQFRRVALDQDAPRADQILATTAASFDDAPGECLTVLRQEMLASLSDRGLFRDEAEAMLNTWEASYFRTAGLRLFFTLPQSWTDRVLPLQVAGYEKTEVVRAMIGRIELFSARQRKLLEQISQGPISDRTWFANWHDANFPAIQPKVEELLEGRTTLQELGLRPPADFRAYMDLGRFRDALIQHEIIHPSRLRKQGHVTVNGTLIQIHHPATSDEKVSAFTITLPGEKRIINLSEMEIHSGDKNITALAHLSQSSNQSGSFPIENLVDGDKNCFSHTETETNPWIKVEFDSPVQIDEVKIWNRADFGGRFAGRFDGAQVTFFDGEKKLVTVEVRTIGSNNLRAFARNYALARQ